MLLIDTCIWSLALRRNPAVLSKADQALVATLKEAIRDGRAAIIGPIRQEILSGIKDRAQFEKIRKTLRPLEDEPLTTDDFERAANLFNFCRSHGVQCGATDILICAVSIRAGWTVLTNDENLIRSMALLQKQGSRSQ